MLIGLKPMTTSNIVRNSMTVFIEKQFASSLRNKGFNVIPLIERDAVEQQEGYSKPSSLMGNIELMPRNSFDLDELIERYQDVNQNKLLVVQLGVNSDSGNIQIFAKDKGMRYVGFITIHYYTMFNDIFNSFVSYRAYFTRREKHSIKMASLVMLREIHEALYYKH